MGERPQDGFVEWATHYRGRGEPWVESGSQELWVEGKNIKERTAGGGIQVTE